MSDEEIKAILDEVGAGWLMDEAAGFCQAKAIRHLIEAVRANDSLEIQRLNALAGPSGKSLKDLEEINDRLLDDNERLRARLGEAC